MKAKDIFEKYIVRCKWLTKDSDNVVRIWTHEPKLHISYCMIDRHIGCYKNSYMSDGVIVGVDVDEFDKLDWEDCIIERNEFEEETFTKKDMIDFVEWTNVIYIDLSHTIAIKDVNNVEELLELFKQTR